ncbi:MAG: M48 family metallopeptidase [Anaerolineales bacterium]
MNEPLELNPERQQRARQYARIRRRLMLAELLGAALYLLLWAASGWANSLPLLYARWLGTAPAWWLQLLLAAAAIGLPWSILTAPLSYYSGFVLPHRYQLSTQSIGGWLVDQVKGLALSLGLGTPLLIGLYATVRSFPETWWLWAAAIYTLVGAVLAALAPVLLLPIFYQVKPLGPEFEDLRRRLLALAEAAHTRVEGVFQIDMSRRTKAANAALTGLGRTRRILLADTLLDSFEDDEIETVLAHELGHHVHRDIPLSLLAESALNFASFYLVYIGLGRLAAVSGLSGQADPAGLPIIGLLLGAFGLVTMPLTNAFSRWRERMADDFALQATQKPAAFVQAMTRLANQNLAEADPERWVVLLLYSHPPLSERIRRAGQTISPA